MSDSLPLGTEPSLCKGPGDRKTELFPSQYPEEYVSLVLMVVPEVSCLLTQEFTPVFLFLGHLKASLVLASERRQFPHSAVSRL